MEQWKSWPIYVYRTPLDTFVLPTKRDFAMLDEQRRRYEIGLEEAQAAVEKFESELETTNSIASVEKKLSDIRAKCDALKKMIEDHDVRVALVVRSNQEKIPHSELMSFELRYPTFDEYLRADELARDWFDDTPRINNGRLARALLADHVKLDGRLLTEVEIGKLDYPVANSLWSEMQAMTYPNYERLPFTSTPSTTSNPEI